MRWVPEAGPALGARGGGDSGLTVVDDVLQAAVKRADHLEELLEQRKWPLSSAK